MKKKVLIDCDPGIDDALALMLALSSPELEILGITTVCGNVPTQQGAENALRILKLMGRLDIPVYCGAETPLVREYIRAQDTHGEDGLGETNLPSVTEAAWRPGAVSFLLDTLHTHDAVTILAIGPLTNIALALQKDASAFAHLAQFVCMGGNYKSYGNCSPVAEYNFWCDPDAAALVYRTLGKRIHTVGLDVTRKICLTPDLLHYMRRLNPKTACFIQEITNFYMDFHWEQEHILGCVINDPLAIAYFLNPALCQGFDAYTEIETQGICVGQSVVDTMKFWKKNPNSTILTHVDVLGFWVCFISRIFKQDTVQIESDLNRLISFKEAE